MLASTVLNAFLHYETGTELRCDPISAVSFGVYEPRARCSIDRTNTLQDMEYYTNSMTAVYCRNETVT